MHCITEWIIRKGTRLTSMEGIHEQHIPPPVSGGGTGLRLVGRAGAGAGCSEAQASPPVARRSGRGRRQGRGPVVARGAGLRRQQGHGDGGSLAARLAMGGVCEGYGGPFYTLPVRRRRWAEAPRFVRLRGQDPAHGGSLGHGPSTL